jgi:DNA-directed RNA polymerase subunit RPC12/RpoP
MNYNKIYEIIIKKAQLENRRKLKKSNIDYIYYELHHILPKSLFPEISNLNEYPENGVLLTAREHFFCHQLLEKIYPGKQMLLSLWRLANDGQNNYCIKNSREYERLKIRFSKFQSLRMKGKKHTEESKNKQSITIKLKMINNPDIKKKYQDNFRKAGKDYARKCKEYSNSVPKEIYISSLLDIENFCKRYNLKKGFTRRIKVKYICMICGKETIQGMKEFTERGKTDFECPHCKKSRQKKENNPNKDGHVNRNRHIKFSEERKKKIGIKSSEVWENENNRKKLSNSMRGSLLWNNGIISVRSKTCPEGFTKGRLPDKRKNNEQKIIRR